MDTISVKEPYLATLVVNLEHILAGFNWRSGVVCLDSQNIMVYCGGIILSPDVTQELILTICKPCHYKLESKQLLLQVLVNYSCVGEQPKKLKERLLAKRYL